ADAARSILDGHIVLDRALTSKGHYPPINVMNSLSRVMPMVTDQDHVRAAADLRELIAAHAEVEDLVAVGAYKPGSRPISDRAITKWPTINGLLRQDKGAGADLTEAVTRLKEIVNG
ncbi:MAG: EscN/YscN/HrcN family type III secretion system ATPase, partial [Fimbriimonadaceae bacterium]|nr:EscN/YscN/HrcN family type III secretion system ATPase [Fimbriimonadaceae bacterium]